MVSQDFRDALDDLEDLIDMHQDNASNLCKSGGMVFLRLIIMLADDVQIAKQACTIFTLANQYNAFVQEFCYKLGISELMSFFCKESTPLALKASLIGCISSIIKGANFEAKKRFVTEIDGLPWLAAQVGQCAKIVGSKRSED